jgi:hypothetical protein
MSASAYWQKHNSKPVEPNLPDLMALESVESESAVDALAAKKARRVARKEQAHTATIAAHMKAIRRKKQPEWFDDEVYGVDRPAAVPISPKLREHR